MKERNSLKRKWIVTILQLRKIGKSNSNHPILRILRLITTFLKRVRLVLHMPMKYLTILSAHHIESHLEQHSTPQVTELVHPSKGKLGLHRVNQQNTNVTPIVDLQDRDSLPHPQQDSDLE